MTKACIVILDFGSQYTQLIARRIREMHVFCEILPYYASENRIFREEVAGIVLSGSPASLHDDSAPRPAPAVFSGQRPVLGICYGCQLMGWFHGASLGQSQRREYGPATLTVLDSEKLFEGFREGENTPVWMSHGDHLLTLPQGFIQTGKTDTVPLASIANPQKQLFGVQFHPEVNHTRDGQRILSNFVLKICGCHSDWTPDTFINDAIRHIQHQVDNGKVICGLSGGVDSSVVAALLDKAIGENLKAIFIDNGLLREGEADSVIGIFQPMLKDRFIAVDAQNRFLERLNGVADPEKKRKIIGEEFIRVFESEASTLGKIDFLAQGTLYPDVIESVSVKGPSATIKTHHNVGGLPEKMNLKLVEPLRYLFKDEVREVGIKLGLPEHLIWRQPFPGPGLAVRILGNVTKERVLVLQKADKIVREEFGNAGLMRSIWQAFAVLLPIRTVGVMGDERTYENVCAIRAVTSTDAMTADWARLPYDLLSRISSRISNEVKGINRVVYDVSSKPPSTIEWE